MGGRRVRSCRDVHKRRGVVCISVLLHLVHDHSLSNGWLVIALSRPVGGLGLCPLSAQTLSSVVVRSSLAK